MKTIKARITGTSPLLMNRPDVESMMKQDSQRKSVGTPEDEFETKKYLTEDGLYYQPAVHLERSFMEAAKKFKVKGNGKATYSKLFANFVTIPDFEIPHKIQPESCEHFITTAKRNTGSRIVIDRPMMRNWELEFELEYDETEIPVEVLQQCIENAGRYCGIGDWRPQTKGKFGKFCLTLFEEVKEAA